MDARNLMVDSFPVETAAIPNRIFQTWKSKEELPKNCAYWRSTLKEKNPGFEFELWDDSDNRRFIEQNAAWFLPTYDSYPAEIYRADIIRYFYLYLKGGIYIDLDTECLRPLTSYLSYPGIVLGRMGSNTDFEHSIPNAVMASRAREPFWLLVIALAMQFSSNRESPPEIQTGPFLLKVALDLYLSNRRWRTSRLMRRCLRRLGEAQQPRPAPSKIFILPSHEWYPLDWSNSDDLALKRQVVNGKLLDEKEKQKLFPKSSLVTYWMHSW